MVSSFKVCLCSKMGWSNFGGEKALNSAIQHHSISTNCFAEMNHSNSTSCLLWDLKFQRLKRYAVVCKNDHFLNPFTTVLVGRNKKNALAAYLLIPYNSHYKKL